MKSFPCIRCSREINIWPGAINYTCKHSACPYGLYTRAGWTFLTNRRLIVWTFLMVLFVFLCMVCYFVGGLVEPQP